MSKILNFINNDIFKIKIVNTIDCRNNDIKIINLKNNFNSSNKQYNKVKKDNIIILPIHIKNINKNIKLTDKINIQNVMIYHNKYQLPEMSINLNETERYKVKIIKRNIRKLYGIRKTKIVKTIKIEDVYVLLVSDINNKNVNNSNEIIFKWEKYNLHKSKYIILDTIIKTIHNKIKKSC